MLPKSLLSIKGRSRTNCTPRHDKEKHLLRKELKRDSSSNMYGRIMVLVFWHSFH